MILNITCLIDRVYLLNLYYWQYNVLCFIQLLLQFAIILYSTNSTSSGITLYSIWIYGMWINYNDDDDDDGLGITGFLD
jgi:hypothetical protein